MPAPTSTYRLQIRPGFDLASAAEACAYLAALGVGAAYLSPLLPSVRASDHGYDTIGYDTIDPQRGGTDGWQRLLAAARERELGVVVDIVPNHTGVADAEQNPAWWDVLLLGRGSVYARWFDIDWTRPRILVPVLGDDFSPDQLSIVGGGSRSPQPELRYFEHRFPLGPGTGPRGNDTAADVHDRQHYELVGYRRADTEQNYRRFFAVSALAGLRVEDATVFDATHAQIGRWLHEDGIAGLRIDHPDGLADPRGYLERLRELAGPDAWLLVEKILEPGEQLPQSWPVAGTTGYDALAEVGDVFVDQSGEPGMDAAYRTLTGDDLSCAEHTARGKRAAAETILAAEVARAARLAPEIENVRAALTELVVAFPVYRSYTPEGLEPLETSLATVRAAHPDLDDALGSLAVRLRDAADELCVRFQQLTGAVMAKGVEDTAFYRYTRFVALNEVGGDPARFGIEPAAFHAAQQRRQRDAAQAMTTLSTHDTKRGEDVRARLAVLAEIPDEWAALAGHLATTAPLPDPGFGYLLWQTFAGAGFIARERMHAYAEKAMREAATATSWTDPAPAFEASVHAAVDRAYDDPAVHDSLAALIERITPYGRSNALGQKLVQLTQPGVADVYQGTELWEDSLVDPDNRRPVDFAARRALLEQLDAAGTPPPVDATGAAKLWIVSRTLRLRRDRPDLFGSYTAKLASGPSAENAVAFDRGGATTVATRLPLGLERAGGWRDTAIDLDGVDVLTGRRYTGQTPLAELLATYPVALVAAEA